MEDIVLAVAGTECKTSWLHINVRSNLWKNDCSLLISFIVLSHLSPHPWSHINSPLRPSKTLSYLRSVKPNTIFALLCFNISSIYIVYIYIYEKILFYIYIPIFLVPSSSLSLFGQSQHLPFPPPPPSINFFLLQLMSDLKNKWTEAIDLYLHNKKEWTRLKEGSDAGGWTAINRMMTQETRL